MALIHPWWAVAVAVALLAVVLVAHLRWRSSSPRPATGSMPVAHLDRVRRLPRYQQLARAGLRSSRMGLAGAALLALGAILLVGQATGTAPAAGADRNRDIVLCLDVSGSMVQTNRDVIAAYLDLAARLDGERIALVVFDATAVTVFPLTDDADFIAEHIAGMEPRLATVIPGTRLGGAGTSLIGDGLASCVQRFDQPDAQRSRTIVLATDNQTFGRPLFTLAEAATRADEAAVMVFGIVPGDNSAAATNELADTVRTTGGDVLLLTPERRMDLGAIEAAVRAQERRALDRPSQSRPVPNDIPGAALCLLGCALVLAAGPLARRSG